MKSWTFRAGSLLLGMPVLLGLVGGCATPGSSSVRHTLGSPVEINNSVSTTVPFEQTWDQFVAQLSQSFFVINNIEKDSRIINVSFTSDSPEMYVDCGTTERDFSFRDEQRTYTYKTAASSRYKEATTWGVYNNLPAVMDVTRSASVEGRANIYVAPSDDGTLVSVNAVYVWTMTGSGSATGYDAFGSVAQRQSVPRSEPTVARLTTKEPGKVTWGDGQSTTCYATGKFEQDVLSLVPR